MRRTISINKAEYPDVVEHLDKLTTADKNISRFFADAARYYIEHLDKPAISKKEIKDLIRDVMQEEEITSISTSSDSKAVKDEKISDAAMKQLMGVNVMFDSIEQTTKE